MLLDERNSSKAIPGSGWVGAKKTGSFCEPDRVAKSPWGGLLSALGLCVMSILTSKD